MPDEATLDSALATLGTYIDELVSTAQSVIDKISTLGDAPDLSDEIDTINSLQTKVSETTGAINTAVAAVPVAELPVVELPAVEPPAAETPA
jgi:hypothetical protein